MTDLRSRCLAGLDLSTGKGLEIGPLNRPLLPRCSGRIFYADHCDTAALKSKYAGNPDVPERDICEVHFDLSQTPLSQIGRYDYVVASHVIEHVPDMVGWLRDIASILNDGGTLALVVPDKRYSFDIFRRETALWMIEEAVGLKRPSIEMVIDHFVNVVHADTGKLWTDPESRHAFRRTVSPLVCRDLIERHAKGEYIDAHCWVFTPELFRTLMESVTKKFNIPLRLCSLTDTLSGQLEFYAQFKKV